MEAQGKRVWGTFVGEVTDALGIAGCVSLGGQKQRQDVS